MLAQRISGIACRVGLHRATLVRFLVAILGVGLLAMVLPSGASARELPALAHVNELHAPAHNGSAYTFDGAPHSVQVYAGALVSASYPGAFEGAHETIAAATGPLPTASPLSVAANTAAPRFIANGAGDILDTTRVTIPEGKFGYLLDNPSKSGVFKDSMGFDQATLAPALRSHLATNFGNASTSVPMIGDGTKFVVRGPLTGPSS